MTIRKGLTFEGRIARLKEIDGYLFVCQRVGHPPLQKELPNCYKTDAQDFRGAHDLAFHNATLKHVGFRPERNATIDELLDEWTLHNQKLEREIGNDGRPKLNPLTVQFYEYQCGLLKKAFAAAKCATVLDIEPSTISKVVRWFRKNTDTGGAITKKSLSMLKSAIAWKGLPASWVIPTREIDAKRREKRDVDSATIAALIAAMPAGSLEEVCAALKRSTGARDVEVYEAQPEDFLLGVPIDVDGAKKIVGVWRPSLHSKRRQKPHLYVLTPAMVAKVRPFVEAAKPGERIFKIAGRPIDRYSLRKRFEKASAIAKITPAIRALAPIRSEVATLIIDESGTAAESDFVGHTEQVARQWYYKDRLTAKKILDRLRIAELLETAIPVRNSA